MLSPGGDAVEMRLDNVARPPDQVRRPAREFNGVLPGTAAEFQYVPGLVAQKADNRRPDGGMVTLKGPRIQPSVGRCWRAGLSEVDDEFCHGCNRTGGGSAISHDRLSRSKANYWANS